jgi:hypothetical protein
MEGGMYDLADHQGRAEPTGSQIDQGAAFGWGQAFAFAINGQLQQAGVLELAKHCRDLLATQLSQVSHKIINILVWRNNGDVSHA